MSPLVTPGVRGGEPRPAGPEAGPEAGRSPGGASAVGGTQTRSRRRGPPGTEGEPHGEARAALPQAQPRASLGHWRGRCRRDWSGLRVAPPQVPPRQELGTPTAPSLRGPASQEAVSGGDMVGPRPWSVPKTWGLALRLVWRGIRTQTSPLGGLMGRLGHGATS